MKEINTEIESLCFPSVIWSNRILGGMLCKQTKINLPKRYAEEKKREKTEWESEKERENYSNRVGEKEVEKQRRQHASDISSVADRSLENDQQCRRQQEKPFIYFTWSITLSSIGRLVFTTLRVELIPFFSRRGTSLWPSPVIWADDPVFASGGALKPWQGANVLRKGWIKRP